MNHWLVMSKSEIDWFHACSIARDEHAFRLYTIDRLKLWQIALRLGVVKSRVGQMIKKHQRREEGLTKW